VRKLVKADAPAGLCGAALAVVPAINFHLAVGRPSCAAIWPAALALLFLSELIDEPRWRHAICFSFALLALLTVDQQMPIFGGVLMVVYLLTVVGERPRAIFNRKLLGFAVVAAMVVAYPFRIFYLRPFFQTPGYTLPHPSEALTYSLPPWMLVHPLHLWRLFGLALVVGLFAAVRLVRIDGRARFGLLCAILGLILTMGPVMSGTNIPLPFAALRALPGFSQFRTPYRFQIPAALGMALALAPVLGRLFERIDGRKPLMLLGALGAVLIGDTVAHRLAYGFPTHRFSEEPIYRVIADTPGDFSVLEVPVGVRSGTAVFGRGDRLMFYQTIHGKRLINGYLARIPIVALDSYKQSPALMFLAAENTDPRPAAADFDNQLRFHKVGFVIVHPELLEPAHLQSVLTLLRAHRGLEPVATGTSTLAFRRSDRPH
jgi:hypothetical protein